MAITFPVSDVQRATKLTEPSPERWIHPLWKGVEAWGASATNTVQSPMNGFVDAVGLAFANHHPLILSPDAVWLAIAQGFAAHIRENSEALRGRFVRHAGTATLSVRRDDFRKGASDNPWPEAFAAFSDAIATHIGKQRDLVVCDFSTTGPCERVASEVVLMDAMSNYFKFEMMTMCGIPEITLEGTVDDWRSIAQRVQALAEYDQAWWVKALTPILDQFVNAAQGRVDTGFWRSIYKLNSASGGPYVTGWINVLLPYTVFDGKQRRNPWVDSWPRGMEETHGGGISQCMLPTGVSVVPFVWEHLGDTYPMLFVGGFVGLAHDAATLAVRPAIGWGVKDAPRP